MKSWSSIWRQPSGNVISCSRRSAVRKSFVGPMLASASAGVSARVVAGRLRVNRSWRRVIVSLANLPRTMSESFGAGHPDQPLERPRRELVVGVEELDVLAERRLQPDVARPAGPARRRDVDHADVGLLPREPVQALAGAVGRAVVDEDDLEPVARHVWRRSERMHGSMYGPGLWAGMTTLTRGRMALWSVRAASTLAGLADRSHGRLSSSIAATTRAQAPPSRTGNVASIRAWYSGAGRGPRSIAATIARSRRVEVLADRAEAVALVVEVALPAHVRAAEHRRPGRTGSTRPAGRGRRALNATDE